MLEENAHHTTKLFFWLIWKAGFVVMAASCSSKFFSPYVVCSFVALENGSCCRGWQHLCETVMSPPPKQVWTCLITVKTKFAGIHLPVLLWMRDCRNNPGLLLVCGNKESAYWVCALLIPHLPSLERVSPASSQSCCASPVSVPFSEGVSHSIKSILLILILTLVWKH